jgi:hypothetical protein
VNKLEKEVLKKITARLGGDDARQITVGTVKAYLLVLSDETSVREQRIFLEDSEPIPAPAQKMPVAEGPAPAEVPDKAN